MNKTPTPHISAKKGDFAPTVLMPGDPLRAKMIAETFLHDYKLINSVRGMFAYTGYYNNKPVSVMGSGMGNASIGIYSYELFNFYDVENIIRVGSAGTFLPHLPLQEIIVAKNVYTDTNYDHFYKKNGDGFVEASSSLVEKCSKISEELGIPVHTGSILSSDNFYTTSQKDVSQELGLLGVEMEGAALYLNAKSANKNALVICTISDNIVNGTHLSSDERQQSLLKMIKLALNLAIQA